MVRALAAAQGIKPGRFIYRVARAPKERGKGNVFRGNHMAKNIFIKLYVSLYLSCCRQVDELISAAKWEKPVGTVRKARFREKPVWDMGIMLVANYDFKDLKVLICDDSLQIRALIRNCLMAFGIKDIVEATDAKVLIIL